MEIEGSGGLFLKIIHVAMCSLEKSSCASGVHIPQFAGPLRAVVINQDDFAA